MAEEILGTLSKVKDLKTVISFQQFLHNLDVTADYPDFSYALL